MILLQIARYLFGAGLCVGVVFLVVYALIELIEMIGDVGEGRFFVIVVLYCGFILAYLGVFVYFVSKLLQYLLN